MNKKVKVLVGILLVLMIVLIRKVVLIEYIKEWGNWTMPIYDEIYLCMDVEDIVIEETSEGLRLLPKEGLSTTKLENLQKDIVKLEGLMEEFPSVEEHLTKAMYSDKKLEVVSFTKAELPKGENTFLLYTSIYEEVLQANGEYLYTAVTSGAWANNSMSGGSDYPAVGDDFVTQTYPEDFVIATDTFEAAYDHEPFMGVSGDDYWCTDGAEHYIKYGLIDDPVGYRQNQSFTLKTEAVTSEAGKVCEVVSCYEHSWDNEWIDVTFESEPSKGEPNRWMVYNYVPFE